MLVHITFQQLCKVAIELIDNSSILGDLFTYSAKYKDISILQACNGGQVL